MQSYSSSHINLSKTLLAGGIDLECGCMLVLCEQAATE